MKSLCDTFPRIKSGDVEEGLSPLKTHIDKLSPSGTGALSTSDLTIQKLCHRFWFGC